MNMPMGQRSNGSVRYIKRFRPQSTTRPRAGAPYLISLCCETGAMQNPLCFNLRMMGAKSLHPGPFVQRIRASVAFYRQCFPTRRSSSIR